jgi:hypothetical protein
MGKPNDIVRPPLKSILAFVGSPGQGKAAKRQQSDLCTTQILLVVLRERQVARVADRLERRRYFFKTRRRGVILLSRTSVPQVVGGAVGREANAF